MLNGWPSWSQDLLANCTTGQKEVDTTGGTAVMWDEKKKEFNTDPNAVLDGRTHGWEDIWQCKNEEARSRTNRAIKEAIGRAKEERAHGAIFTSGLRIAEAANSFKKHTQ